jgi:adenine/guanine phosphoribosyltransferase-like PRPP-binding protein
MNEHLEALSRVGGYYECPKDPTGYRFGPLVGYAGKYLTPEGEEKQWVGDAYANFAKADEHPHLLVRYAECLFEQIYRPLKKIDAFCGAPLGGYSFSNILGFIYRKDVIKAEKKVTALATATSREQSTIGFSRHSINEGSFYAIVEDVCNNFSTTESLIDLIESLGGIVTAIVCGLNRSIAVDDYYFSQTIGRKIPVIGLVRKPIPEYRQDDPAVADDIARGNVVWKPKNDWPRLMKAMTDHN